MSTALTTTPTTRIEAVNQLLHAIGESPISSLSGDLGVDGVTAIAVLKEIQRAVLTEGWLFNTEYNYPLIRDLDGYITTPANTLKCDIDRHTAGSADPVLRGIKVYDRAGHTYKFSANLTATMVFGLPFEEMPESARHYITYRACRKFQNNQVGSPELNRFNEADEYRARALFMDDQAQDEDLNLIRDTPDFAPLRRY